MIAVSCSVGIELLKVHVSVSDTKKADLEINVDACAFADKICHGCNYFSDN